MTPRQKKRVICRLRRIGQAIQSMSSALEYGPDGGAYFLEIAKRALKESQP